MNMYKMIDEENRYKTREVFSQYINGLELPIVDYVAIGVQESISQKSASLMSNLDWQKEFKQKGYHICDPIRQTSLKTSTKIFTFDEVICNSVSAKEVMNQRKRFGINNGFVIMNRTKQYNFILTMATGYMNFNARKFYLENTRILNIIFVDLQTIIANLPEVRDIIYHTSDAK